MKKIEQKLLPIARKWAGNIPIWEVRRAGIDPSAVRHWAQNNPDVLHTDHGVYTWFCDDENIDWEHSEAARLIAQAGEGAYLWGSTALEFMEIGDVGQPYYEVAVPTRRRKKERVFWVVDPSKDYVIYNGLPVQPLDKALQASMPDLERDKQFSVLDDVKRRFPEYQPLVQQLEETYDFAN